MTTDQERLHAVVRGRVQGVSFRYYTQATARRLGLSGWVRNLPAGTVEVMAEGPGEALDALLAFLHRGPPAAHVAGVDAQRSPALGDLGPFDVTV